MNYATSIVVVFSAAILSLENLQLYHFQPEYFDMMYSS